LIFINSKPIGREYVTTGEDQSIKVLGKYYWMNIWFHLSLPLYYF
jgi:hypothetical protein